VHTSFTVAKSDISAIAESRNTTASSAGTPTASTATTGTHRNNVQPGFKVQIVQKQDQRTGKLTDGIVASLLTNSATHPHGIKVKLRDGTVGRVQKVMSSG